MIPGVDIEFDNGNIGEVTPSEDGVFALLASAVPVGDTFELNTPYLLKGMKDVADRGILPDVNNYTLYTWLKEFYQEAGEGTKLWLFGMIKTNNVSSWFTKDPKNGEYPFKKMLDEAKGKISGIFTSFAPGPSYTLEIENGLDKDVKLAKQQAQIFAEEYTDLKASPLFVILEGYGFNGNAQELEDLNLERNNRVGVFIGANSSSLDTPAMLGASTQTLAGRLAKIAVSKNAGEKKSGALNILNTYIGAIEVEKYDIAALYEKRYITYRTHPRKAGYYILDTPLATDPEEDDYHNIELRRTIDKAYRIAHDIASEEINTDFDVTNEGTISPFYAKAIETKVERAIYEQMTIKKELSKDTSNKDDLGVIAKFDDTINVVTTKRISMQIKVRPRGYSKFFKLLIGYYINLNR